MATNSESYWLINTLGLRRSFQLFLNYRTAAYLLGLRGNNVDAAAKFAHRHGNGGIFGLAQVGYIRKKICWLVKTAPF